VKSGAVKSAAGSLAGMLILALCASGCASTASVTSPAAGSVTGSAARTVAGTSLATSLTTARDAWAIVPMSSGLAFWQVFARPASAADWKLVTPPGVADNGGLVAAGSGGAVTMAVRPSQDLTFSPLAVSSDGGGQWATGLLDADIASAPDALASDGRYLAALLDNGAIMTSSDGGATWRTLAVAFSPPGSVPSSAGKTCGLSGVNAVSIGMDGTVLAAATCTGTGSGLFAYRGGQWSPVTLPTAGHVVRLTGDTALVEQGTRLTAVWDTAAGWRASSSDAMATGGIVAAGSLTNGAAWVLLSGGGAAVAAGADRAWRVLPRVPRGTSVLAAGPDGTVDALAVHGSDLDVWRLPAGTSSGAAWRQVQTISVPIQYGSSS
jgi:hypothetical protein